MSRPVLVLLAAAALLASQGYQKPPKEVLEVLNAPLPPVLWASPAGTHVLLGQISRYPSIGDVARPFLGLAGIRFDPATSGPQLLQYCRELKLKDLRTGKETQIVLPADARLGIPSWSPDGSSFVVTNTTAAAVQLLSGDTATGRVRTIPGLALNSILGAPFSWMGSKALLLRTVPAGRGKPPARPEVPAGPVIQESSGQSGPVRTYQDMISSPWEEDLFEHYASAQVAVLELASGKLTPVGKPGLYTSAADAPDGRNILVQRLRRPYSYLHPWPLFPRDIEVWDTAGRLVHKVASLPLADRVPIDGVPTGPRGVRWLAGDPATLIWTEALDEGDPRKKVSHRDRLMRFRAPFNTEPVEVLRTVHRLVNWTPLEGSARALVSDYDRDRRWVHTVMADLSSPGTAAREIWSLSVNDRYSDPGNPVMQPTPAGEMVAAVRNGSLLLQGLGATPHGDRPFLDRMSLETLKTDRIHRSEASE